MCNLKPVTASVVHSEWSSPFKTWYISDTAWRRASYLCKVKKLLPWELLLKFWARSTAMSRRRLRLVCRDTIQHEQPWQTAWWLNAALLWRTEWGAFVGQRRTADFFQPFEASSQTFAVCRPPPHDRRVQFWWMEKLVIFVGEQSLINNIWSGVLTYFSRATSDRSVLWLFSAYFKTLFPTKKIRLVLFFFPFSVPSSFIT